MLRRVSTGFSSADAHGTLCAADLNCRGDHGRPRLKVAS
jgi:hypothetical protein